MGTRPYVLGKVIALLLAVVALQTPGLPPVPDPVSVPSILVETIRNPPADADTVTSPIDLAVAPDGDAYLLEGRSCRVTRVSGDDRAEDLWGGCGQGEGRFLHPFAIAAGAERVYVGELSTRSRASFGDDAVYFRIEVFDRSGRYLHAIEDSRPVRSALPRHPRGYFDLLGALHDPVGLAVDAQGQLHVLDALGRRWTSYDRDGELMEARAPEPERIWQGRPSPSSAREAPKAGRVAITPEGVLYAIWPEPLQIYRYLRDGDRILVEPADRIPNGAPPLDVGIGAKGSLYVSTTDGLWRPTPDGSWPGWEIALERAAIGGRATTAIAGTPDDGIAFAAMPTGKDGSWRVLQAWAPGATSPTRRWGRAADRSAWLGSRSWPIELQPHPFGGIVALFGSTDAGPGAGAGWSLHRYNAAGGLLWHAGSRARWDPLREPQRLAPLPDGGVAVYDAADGGRLRRFDRAGRPLPDWDPGPVVPVADLASDAEGRLYVLERPSPTPTLPRAGPYPPPWTPSATPTATASPTPPPSATLGPPSARVLVYGPKGAAIERDLRVALAPPFEQPRHLAIAPDDGSLLMFDETEEGTLLRRIDPRSGASRSESLVTNAGRRQGVFTPRGGPLALAQEDRVQVVGHFAEGPFLEGLWLFDSAGRGRMHGAAHQRYYHSTVDERDRLWLTAWESSRANVRGELDELLLQLWAPRRPEVWRASLHAGRHLAGAPIAVTETAQAHLPSTFGAELDDLLAAGDGASARLERSVDLGSGIYAFTLRGQGGARLRLDGEILVDRWHGAAYDVTVQRLLTGSSVQRIVLETRSAAPEDGGAMDVALTWERRGAAHAIFLPWGTTEQGPHPIPLPSAPPPSPTPDGYPGP